MNGYVFLAFYVGMYVGGVMALWTVARVFRVPMRWRAALMWPAAYEEQADKVEAEIDARRGKA
jgi:hypothetical protein